MRKAVIGLAGAALVFGAGTASAQEPLSPPPAQPGQVAPSSPMTATRGSTVRVHVHAYKDRAAQLATRPGPDAAWTPVCDVPCTVILPTANEYQVTLGESEQHLFGLSPDAGREVDLEVRPASKGQLAGGIVMTSLGGVTALVGVMLLALQSAMDSAVSSGGSSGSDEVGVAGWGCLGVGSAVAIGGIVLITSRSTEPRVNQSPYGARAAGNRALFEDAASNRRRELPATPSAPFGVSFAF